MKSINQAPTPRLISLDVFRGITIALMILVNSPGNGTPYRWLQHSIWNGCTLADLVFPFFIVIVGISSALALSNLTARGVPFPELIKKIIWRSVYIFLMGLFLNAFPHHFDVSSLRVLGVLQRIAICYFFTSVLFLTTEIRTQAFILGVLLMGYGCLMSYFSPLGVGSWDDNLVGYVDRFVFSSSHLYTATFDPEGLLSTLPALASALLGNLIGYFLMSPRTQEQTFKWLMIAGLMLAASGWMWSYLLPLNKSLWSSSYVLWTGGLALLVFAPVYALIEIKKCKNWSIPFSSLGRHAMLVYMLHVLFLKIQAMILLPNVIGELIGLRLYLTNRIFGYLQPENASLAYSMSYTLFWLFVILGVERVQQLNHPNRIVAV
jgi:predicted acyltransferase